MVGQFWLTCAQVERLKPYFPKTRGKPRMDNRRVLSGIVAFEAAPDLAGRLAFGRAAQDVDAGRQVTRMGLSPRLAIA